MIDEKDLQILKILQRNARKSFTELGKQVGLSTAQCWKRVKELELNCFIERYVTIINRDAVGLPYTVIVKVAVQEDGGETLDAIATALTNLSEVSEAYLAPQERVFYLKTFVHGIEGYERFLREKLYKIPGIGRARARFVLRTLKQNASVNIEAAANSASIGEGLRRPITPKKIEEVRGH